MSTTQRFKKMRYADGDGEVHLDEGVVGEILLRLPAASLLRCRAVCEAWRRIADSPEFIAEHARRRPVEILLYTRYEVGPDGVRRRDVYGGGDEVHLDALAVVPGASGRRRRPLARYPVVDKNPEYLARPYCSLVASCDGLLLLGRGGGSGRRPYDSYLVCNPATRQWTQLPPLTAAAGDQPPGIVPAHLEIRESGFYRHAPSGEYRLLCHVTPVGGGAQAPPYYCVLSAGATEPRRLTAPATPTEQTMAVVPGSDPPQLKPRYFQNLMTPAALGGRLHWLRHMEAGLTGSMVAFDTVGEAFCQMPPPPVACKGEDPRLLVADGSTLMAAELGGLVLNLWALEGYTGCGEEETTRWALRHRVEVPWRVERPPSVVAGAEDGSGGVVLASKYGVVAYDVRSRAARRVADGMLLASRHVLRESLVRHAFFGARPHPGLPLFHFF